jgi:DNA (cytosine-5)-methyltransferase 1
MNYLDLFCGAGGLSLGFIEAGWNCVGALDSWEDAAETYNQNFPKHDIHRGDVATFSAKRLGLKRGEVDFIIGGPPCQGFSTVGKRVRNDPRNSLVSHFARLVDEIAPTGFLIENVVGLRDMSFVDDVRELFEQFGYRTEVAVLRAADYGIPQLRHRIFFIGRKDGRLFRFPQPTHKSRGYVTVWDAIGDLPELSAGESAQSYDSRALTAYQRKMRLGSKLLQGHDASAHPRSLVQAISFIPDGGNRRSIPDRYQPRSGFHNSYSRLHSRSPAVAVTQNMGKPSGTRCIHPFQDRGLTAREGARLQGFPDRFHFIGGSTSQRLQIANAVSPILARVLAESLAEDQSWHRDVKSDYYGSAPVFTVG